MQQQQALLSWRFPFLEGHNRPRAPTKYQINLSIDRPPTPPPLPEASLAGAFDKHYTDLLRARKTE
jgi:hypothetical protein